MKRGWLILLSFLLCINFDYAQSLLDNIIEVQSLIKEDKYTEADSLLKNIESFCMSSGKDSILVLFYESKGVLLLEQEKYKDCIPYFLKTIELYKNLNIKALNYLEAFEAIGFSYGRLRDYENAERYYRKALIKSVTAPFNNQFRPNVYQNLGNLYREKGDTLLAVECFKRVGRNDNTDMNFMYLNYLDWETSLWKKINNLVTQSKYEEAVRLYVELINGIKEKQGICDSYILAVYNRGILLSRYLEKYEEARPLFEEIVSLCDRILLPNENICGSYCNLALCYSILGDEVSINQLESEAIDYLAHANVEGYPPHMFYRFVGNGAYWTENYEQAITYYERYLNPQYTRERGTSYEEITIQLSVAYIKSNYPSKAIDLLNSLLRKEEQILYKANRELLATIYHNLGRAYMLSQDNKEALLYLNKSKNLQTVLYGSVANRTEQYIKECQMN